MDALILTLQSDPQLKVPAIFDDLKSIFTQVKSHAGADNTLVKSHAGADNTLVKSHAGADNTLVKTHAGADNTLVNAEAEDNNSQTPHQSESHEPPPRKRAKKQSNIDREI